MKSLKQKIGPKSLKLDQRTLEKIADIEKDGIIVGKTLELLQSLRDQCEMRGFLTEAQRGLVRKIERDFEDYPLWLEARNRLTELYNDGRLNPASYAFVESVIAQFDERHFWTTLQREQIINLIQRNDPEEDGADDTEKIQGDED